MNGKKTSIIAVWAVCMLAMLFSACTSKDENAAEERVKTFAQHYFNLRYKQAAAYCTDGSLRWIKYRAANINQADLDLFNSQPDSAVCAIEDFAYNDDDKATANITVKNFLRSDSVGKKGIIVGERGFAYR